MCSINFFPTRPLNNSTIWRSLEPRFFGRWWRLFERKKYADKTGLHSLHIEDVDYSNKEIGPEWVCCEEIVQQDIGNSFIEGSILGYYKCGNYRAHMGKNRWYDKKCRSVLFAEIRTKQEDYGGLSFPGKTGAEGLRPSLPLLNLPYSEMPSMSWSVTADRTLRTQSRKSWKRQFQKRCTENLKSASNKEFNFIFHINFGSS